MRGAEGAPSQSQKGHFSEKTKLKRYDTKTPGTGKMSAPSLEIFATSCDICQSMGVSSRKGEHFFGQKMACTRIKPGIVHYTLYYNESVSLIYIRNLNVNMWKRMYTTENKTCELDIEIVVYETIIACFFSFYTSLRQE